MVKGRQHARGQLATIHAAGVEPRRIWLELQPPVRHIHKQKDLTTRKALYPGMLLV